MKKVREEGLEKVKEEVATNLIKSGDMSYEKIAQVTGLSLSRIRSLVES